MYDYWGKLLHMSEKFCNFASAMKGAPRERKEESGKRKEECGEPEVRRPRTERPSAMKRRSVRDGEEPPPSPLPKRGKEEEERKTNKPNNGL